MELEEPNEMPTVSTFDAARLVESVESQGTCKFFTVMQGFPHALTYVGVVSRVCTDGVHRCRATLGLSFKVADLHQTVSTARSGQSHPGPVLNSTA